MSRAEALDRAEWVVYNLTGPREKEAARIAFDALRDQKRVTRDELVSILEAAEGQVNNDQPTLEQIADYLIDQGVVAVRYGDAEL